MRVIFAGTPLNAAATLIALKKSGIDIVGVLTRTDAPLGRKKILTQSPVADAAQALGIPLVKANQVDEAVLEQLETFNADLGVVVAYGAFLNETALRYLPNGWINLHYSLLPALRGAAPVQHALLQGMSSTGVTVFQLDKGMDTGSILLQAPTVIEPDENAGRLLNRLTDLGITVLLELLPSIAAGIAKRIPQDESGATLAPKIHRSHAQINWNMSAKSIQQLVLAMNPEPVAWTTLDEASFRILDAREYRGANLQVSPGCVELQDAKVLVACNNGALQLFTVQPAGKNEMSATDWYRGLQNRGQIVLGS
jgi:methionyl-tRNA formyltransferase